ncbi:BREX-1 system adenine-specific DNA-methyltransferase PglX, partial [Pseudomonas extremaustralis]|uniref:BREX-1 system adenine-specific DNA-methyltransferase PglX n=1 Tax=Pseudomonas extremaustralis TaxID=359110 RepID=UPI0023081F0D
GQVLHSVFAAAKIKLDRIIDLLTVVRSQGDDLSRSYANQVLEHFAFPASLLALKYDAVVANPPYMGGKYLNDALRVFSKKEYNSTKSDMFAMFIARGFTWCKSSGFNSMVTMQSWMFLSSYEKFREHVIDSNTLNSLVHLPYDGKGPTAMGINFGLGVFSFYGSHVRGYKSSFDCFRYFELLDNGCPKNFPSNNERSVKAVPDDFKKIPGSPLAYWVPESVRVAYEKSFPISNYAEAKQGLATADNNRFLRQWYEIEFGKIGFDFSSLNDAVCSGRKFFPYNKGGEFRKWYGNQLYVVNWKDNGYEIRNFSDGNGKIRSRPQNTQCYFRPSVSWSDITSGTASFRYFPKGFIYDITGMSAQSDNEDTLLKVLAYCNTKLIQWVTKTTNPTMHFQIGNYSSLPVIEEAFDSIDIDLVREAVEIAKEDCEYHEVSWGFKINPLVGSLDSAKTIESAWIGWAEKLRSAVDRVREIEESNNQRVINAFGLDDEIDFKVSDEEVTLTVADRESDCISLVSYAIGCMVGRYSLDEVGITYAHSGGGDFDFSRYARFPADADGIIPITEEAWFEDDGAARVHDFVEVVWGAATLPENLEWLANSLGRKSGESASEAIRRYLAVNFFKDHVQSYKKRPIYWLFSSGKQKAFECLVYLHRYNEGTLSRMRMEYVVPLQSRMQARIDKLAGDISSATGSAQQKSLQKRKDKLTKQLEELRRFDETLRPYADQRIVLDLDDGVRVNYGKFGDLLAEVKTITGGKED